MIAVERSNTKMGTMNVNANRNLEANVANVDSQISFVVWIFSASSETWMPRASEHASAIAIVKIPPIITNSDPEKEWRPTINPSVVIIAEVKPKHNPFLIESFIATTPSSCWTILSHTLLRLIPTKNAPRT
jgi:hypothetical protein